MDTDGFRKAIHFDLDTATVESTFGKKNTSMAYRKIRKFSRIEWFCALSVFRIYVTETDVRFRCISDI